MDAVDSYEWALGRVPELEVNLASAVDALERAQSDNSTLKDVHADLVNAFRRLQDDHSRLRGQLRKEQDLRHRLSDEHLRHQANWRAQLEQRTRELEELSVRPVAVAQREVEALRLQIADEVEAGHACKMRELDIRLANEQKKVVETQRQVRQLQADAAIREQEIFEQLEDSNRRTRVKEETLERQVFVLAEFEKRAFDAEACAKRIRLQLHVAESRNSAIQKSIDDLETQNNKERSTAAAELQARVEEVSASRRKANDLQVQLLQQENRIAQMSEEVDVGRREHADMLGQARNELAAAFASNSAPRAETLAEVDALRNELATLRQSQNSEREQHARKLDAAECALKSATQACQRAETKAQQLKVELDNRDKEAKAETKNLERRFSSELAAAKTRADTAEKDTGVIRQSAREREQTLQRQIDDAIARSEAVGDELVQCQAAHEAATRQMLAAQTEVKADTEHRLESELSSLRQRNAALEHERAEQSKELETTKANVRLQQQRADALKVELAAFSTKLDVERATWARDAEETHRAALNVEEQRRVAAVKDAQEEHRRQLNMVHIATKKTLQKSAKRRQDYKQRIQELFKKLTKTKQERQLAVRICEENRAVYEAKLAELGFAAGMGRLSCGNPMDATLSMPQAAAVFATNRSNPPLATVGLSTSLQRKELRAISDRLEQQAAWVRERYKIDDEPTGADAVAAGPAQSLPQ